MPRVPCPLRHSLLPGVSLFRRFRCYLDRPPAQHGSLRHPSLPGVSLFRRIGSHLRRVTQAPRPGAMAAGAQEQAASCDAFVLSRRQSAPDAPPSRTSPLCLIAKPFPEPSPNHGPVLGWDCRCEFRQARSRAPLPDGVLTVVGMTDGVWQGGSVMSTLRRGPCRASRHDRGRRKTPRAPRLTLPTSPALVYSRRNATCLAWLSATSATARCEACSGVPAATCTRYRRRSVRGTFAGARNIAAPWNFAEPWNLCRVVESLPTRGTLRHRGTLPCAPGAFSLTVMIFRSPRAQKETWCAPQSGQTRLRCPAF